MKDSSANQYERAFENWLRDQGVAYVRADEHKRLGPSTTSVKNFDFLLSIRPDREVIVEVKGRTFHGTRVAKRTGFECWVTMDDIESLQTWQRALGPDHEAVFVFAYRVAKVDVDFDGHRAFGFAGDRYLFFCIRLEDYCQFMRRRSPKWRTMTLPAERFRQCAVPLAAWLS